MASARGVLLTAAGVFVALTSLGCNRELKERNLSLQNEVGILNQRLKERQAELAQAEAETTRLTGQLNDTRDELTRTKQQLAEELAAGGTSKPPAGPTGAAAAGWQRTTIGDRVTVGSDVLFASGSATLSASGRRALNRIAADLRARYPGLPVRVYGYTDSDPIVKSRKLWSDNLDLSANRAMAVVRYLRAKGISPGSMEAIGMGETHPVASNATRAGKSKNRRVEIIVITGRG